MSLSPAELHSSEKMGSGSDDIFLAPTDYETQIVSCALLSNSIVYQPHVRIGDFICLKVIQDLSHFTSYPHMKHIIVIVPTIYMVKHLIQFLRRHLCTSSIESWLGPPCPSDPDLMFKSITEHLWAKVIVTPSSALPSLFTYGLKLSQLALIVIYDCTSMVQDTDLVEIIRSVKEAEIQPRILCFASSLVNDCLDVEEMGSSVLELEELLYSNLIAVSNHPSLARIMPHTADSFCTYKHYEVVENPCLLGIVQELSDTVEKFCGFDFQFNHKLNGMCEKISTSYHDVRDILLDIKYHLEDLGEYAGSVATLAAIRNLIYLNAFTEENVNQTTKLMLNHLICCISEFRKLLEEDMFRVQLCERIERFSSDKVKSLLKRLKKLEKKQRAVIVIKKPHSAVILATILQNVVRNDKNLAHLKPELILDGSGIPVSDSWHDILAWERNTDVYARFVALQTNVIILSGQLQGLDPPECDVVIVMEKVDQFSQYICFKKIAKSGFGELVMFCDESSISRYEEQINGFHAMEQKMREMLVVDSKFEADKDFTGHEDDGSIENWSFSVGKGNVVTLKNSISIINKFCSKIPSDMFTQCQPLWFKQDYPNPSNGEEVGVNLHLPRTLPNNIIKGDKANSFEAGKKVAAFRACEALILRKELNDCLERNSEANSKFESKLLATEEGPDGAEFLCDILHPAAFTRAQPLPGFKSFVHAIRMHPVSPPPPPGDNRKTVLYELLSDRSCFAILSTKPLPKICNFPVFVYGHEVSVEINTIEKEVIFTEEEFSYLRRFHCGIFLNVVPLVQPFMQFDLQNSENSFFVAPLTPGGEIDWETIKIHYSVPTVRTLTPVERADLECSLETHERIMVAPWYRPLPNYQIYVVASVCTDMCADSCFPTEEYETFTDYYRERYRIDLMRPELPLLEVCLVNTKFNGLLPRKSSHKLRREEKMEDFREHMVPELCQPLMFPSSLWLKLSSLPSVLHRLTRLLVIDDVRRNISLETGLGELEKDWPAFTTNHFSFSEEIAPSKIAPSAVKRGLVIGNVKLEERKRQARIKKPWGVAQEPVDMDRNLESLNELEIRYFEEFILRDSSDCSQTLSDLAADSDQVEGLEDHMSHINMQDSIDYNKIHIMLLNTNRVGCGPQLHEMLEAFTSSFSSDVVNMDRIHVLGNAFLTFVVSVYLFVMNPTVMSTKLSQLRKEFLRRERIALCGQQKNLCGAIKVLEFSPGDWIPPSFTTPPMLKEVLIDQDINPSVLPRISLRETEQISGFIGDDSQEEILDILTSFVNRGISKREEAFVGRQYVTVETASQCVEAVIGTYFKTYSWDGALKIIDWLGLFPSGSIDGLLDCEGTSVSSHVPSSLLHQLNSLERILDYDFQEKHRLVEAVTHSSYVSHSISGCMDRLVFLGESVLDIILTTYVFEKCDHLAPSKLSSLRKVLMSHSTLAALAVRHELHKFLLMSSSSLLSAVDRFVKHQEENHHEINDKVCLLIEEHECDSIYRVELPAVLGNMLPALVGAIYLDAGKNLMSIWKVIHNIFVPQINAWKNEVPSSVVDLLMDLSPAAHQVIFSSPIPAHDDGVEVSCTLLVDNTREEVFRAWGPDGAKAKTLAAKLALRALFGSPEASIEM